MATKKKLLQAAAGSAGGAGGLNVEEVFSTYLYTGNGTDDRAINNGIDLSGEGGMVWIKNRDFAFDHLIGDTERGITKGIKPNNTVPENNFSDRIKTVTSTGFTIGTADDINSSNTGYTGSLMNYASWTFRKAPKFFDVVTYTGDGVAGRTVSHNLGSTPAVIIVKPTGVASSWYVYHSSVGASKYLRLDTTGGEVTNSTVWNNTAPTDTQFTVGTSSVSNGSGNTYVAYLFAHNDGDGDFGPDGDADIIKCGSFTTDSSGVASVDLGFEPQFLLVKSSSTTDNWVMIDNMRGWTTGGASPGLDARLFPNLSNAESAGANIADLTATGFEYDGVDSVRTYIYIAIRRGPMAVPTDATEVFTPTARSSDVGSVSLSFSPDFLMSAYRNSATGFYVQSRLTLRSLQTHSTAAEFSTINGALTKESDKYLPQNSTADWFYSTTPFTTIDYALRRAPNYFDVVAYSGNGVAGRTVSHNLGVAPEMIWIKARNKLDNWPVFHKNVPNTQYLTLDRDRAVITASTVWNNTSPTETDFTVGTYTGINGSGYNYIAYLFASLDGVSKVGSYTGNGSSQTIDCGFSSGARFILIKRTDSTGEWYVWDTERGIVAGNDPYLELSTTDAEVTSTDWVDPDNSGFIVNGTTINASSAEYIFYAVA